MSLAFVDTTVLTDFLLKRDGSEVAAKAAFGRFTTVEVPQFAWKEFKRGPLSNFAWAHNKLLETGSFSKFLVSLQKLSRTPHRYLTSTAIQALQSAFADRFRGVPISELQKRYGPKADLDTVHADVLRLEIKSIMVSAWEKRAALYGGAVQRLSCYVDAPVKLPKDRIDLSPKDCAADADCCIRGRISAKDRVLLKKARDAIAPLRESKLEIRKRFDVLRSLEVHPNSSIGPRECRSFGDAYFVVFCPAGGTVLTNNISDIEPMARALSVSIARP